MYVAFGASRETASFQTSYSKCEAAKSQRAARRFAKKRRTSQASMVSFSLARTSSIPCCCVSNTLKRVPREELRLMSLPRKCSPNRFSESSININQNKSLRFALLIASEEIRGLGAGNATLVCWNPCANQCSGSHGLHDELDENEQCSHERPQAEPAERALHSGRKRSLIKAREPYLVINCKLVGARSRL